MSRLRVLLADDHRIVAEGLRRLLEAEFELVAIVEDGNALVEATRRLTPDVIVADIGMPGMNGIEALETLRREGSEVRFVFLTMHRDVAYARRALDAGAQGYVLKHSAPEELVLAVRAAATGRTFVTSAIAAEVLAAIRSGSDGYGDTARRLTPRQREILRLVVDGQSAKQIAARLGISPRTVEFHKYAMMETVGVASTAELIRFALQQGIAEG